jgi:FkbM family methyltransferase
VTEAKISPFDVKPDLKDGFLTPDFFASLSFDIDLIIDVGVSRGTPWLYQSFADKKFLLIDPIPGFDANLMNPPKSHTCINVGLSGTPGKMTLDLRGPRSSLHQWQSTIPKKSEGTVEVPIETLDNVIRTHAPDSRFGLKIDTEGHEIGVLEGLNDYVGNAEFLICESSIRKRFEDDYWFSDLIAMAASKGFELYNFVSPQQPRPTHYDCLFLKRSDKRFGLGAF